MAHIESKGNNEVRVGDDGSRTPLGMMSVQTEEIVKRQQDKPHNVGVFNDGAKGEDGGLEGMPTSDEDRFDESDFNLSLRYPHAIRKMWGDEIAIEVMEAMLLNKPFELLKLKLLQKGEQDAR